MPYQSKDPSPTIPTHRMIEAKGKTVKGNKGSEQLGQNKGIGPALEICQSYTIKHRVSMIIQEIHREGNKSPAVL